MTQQEESQLRSKVDIATARIEAMQLSFNDLAKTLLDASRRLGEIASDVEMLKADAEENTGTEEGDDDNSLAKDMAETASAANRIEDPQVVIPDAQAWSGDSTRKSIEWAPEMANIPQLNEFDDAPSIGCLRVIRKGRKIMLADPDDKTGQRKWMIPLRREDTTKELKWAMIGEDSDSDSSDSDSDTPYIPDPQPPLPPYPGPYVPPEPPDPDDSDSDEPPEHIYIVIPNPDYDPDDSDSDNDNPWMLYDISGFFWLRGGSAVTNYGTSLKLGNRAIGYVTISVE